MIILISAKLLKDAFQSAIVLNGWWQQSKLTPWFRVVLQKFIVNQLVKKFSIHDIWRSLLNLPEPTIGPYLEPGESSLCPRILFH
jgi:hypothetical protein